MKTITILSTVFLASITSAFLIYATGNDTHYYFAFDETHYPPTLYNVQDESKWIKVPGLGACDNNRVRPCRIEVSGQYVRENMLLPTATITAQESSRDTAFVTGGFIIGFEKITPCLSYI